MTVFTYAAPVGTPGMQADHERLLGLWRQYWFQSGFRAHVERPKGLPHEDKGLFRKVREAFKAAPTVNDRDYELACFIRWVFAARFAMSISGPILCVDSDVFPDPKLVFEHDFFGSPVKYWDAKSKFPTFLEPDRVPCAVLGDGEQLAAFAVACAEGMLDAVEEYNGESHTSDQFVAQNELWLELTTRTLCRNVGERPAGAPATPLLHVKTDYCIKHRPGVPKYAVVKEVLPAPTRSRPM